MPVGGGRPHPPWAQLGEGQVRDLSVTPLPTDLVSLFLTLPHGQILRPLPPTSSPGRCPAPSLSSRLLAESLGRAALQRMAGT